MDAITYKALCQDAGQALQCRHISRALEVLDALAAALKQGAVLSALQEIREEYALLMDYFIKGMNDPDRERMVERNLRKAYELFDELQRTWNIQEGSSHYATVRNTLTRMGVPESLSGYALPQCSPRQLFECAWTAPAWQTADTTAATAFMQETGEPDDMRERKALLISATMLSLLYHFDARRLQFLLTMAEQTDIQLRARAIIGVVLAFLRHRQRIAHHPELLAQSSLLVEQPDIRKALVSLQTQLFLTLETKRIERSLREDIIPEVMRRVKEQQKRNPNGMGMEPLTEADLNPEWEADGSLSQLGKKMRELSEMQRKGADVFMSSFKMLKQNYPFFSVAANWFHPFTLNHPDLKGCTHLPSRMLSLLNQANLCDSDRYSMALMLSQLPAMGGNTFMKDQIENSLSSLPEEGMPQEEGMQLPDAQLALAIRTHIQDLHRYFKLFRHRDREVDPFSDALLITDCPPFDRLLSDTAVIRQLADFAFEEQHYDLALGYYRLLPETAAICQKTGYACQMLHDHSAAVTAYRRALLLQEGSEWTLRQLAGCLRTLGKHEEALSCYKELEKSNPDDRRLLLLMGDSYLRTRDFESAFSKLFKADYLYPDDAQAIRALAWCSLLTGKHGQSERYYQKIFGLSPTADDYLNAGHNAWLAGNIPQAIDHYQTSLQIAHKEFVPADFFEADRQLLLEHGKTDAELALMLDAVNTRYRPAPQAPSAGENP